MARRVREPEPIATQKALFVSEVAMIAQGHFVSQASKGTGVYAHKAAPLQRDALPVSSVSMSTISVSCSV
jgi:hypothetical protein